MNIKNIVTFSLGPIGTLFLSAITLPLMAWLFEPQDLGRLNLFQAVISFFLLLSVLGLDQAYVREYHELVDVGQLFQTCFIPGFLILTFCVIATVFFGKEINIWLFDVEGEIYYILLVVAIYSAYISRFFSLVLRMQERGVAFSLGQLIPKIIVLIFFAFIIYKDIHRDFLLLLIIMSVSTLSVLFVYGWSTRSNMQAALRAEFNFRQIVGLLKFGSPLTLSGLAFWGLTSTSTLVLKKYSNLDELGIYAVANYFSIAASVFQSIFTIVWAPTVYKWVSQGVDMTRVDAVARQALSLVCAIFVLAGILSWVTDFLLPSHYVNVKYMVLCSIAPPLIYTLSEVTCVGIGISRRTVLTVWVTLTALATNVLLNLWLVPSHGAAGAVMSNAVAYLVFFIARTEASAFVWRQFPRRKLYVFLSLATSLSVATVAFSASLPFHYALVWLALAPIVGLCFRVEWVDLVALGRNAWRNRLSRY